MHGRVKTRTTEEQKKIAKIEKSKKVRAYQNAMKIIVEKRSSQCYDQEALDVTATVLLGNPDIITLWNYRREIFLNLKNEDDLKGYQVLLEKDLNLTELCLRVNPKSYGSWHHRVWVLNNLPEPNWERELELCTKYLKLDERNFHCWDYRRIVTQNSNVSDLSEYEYTLEKIKTNFSNYSAWHLRSKLLPKIFPDPEKKFPINETKHKEELELVENAAFTDPNDQSAWFYQRWLLGLTEPKIDFVYAKAQEDCILIITSKNIKLDQQCSVGVTVKIILNGVYIKGVWSSESETQSCIWNFHPETKIQPDDDIDLVLEENGMEYTKKKIKLFKPVSYKPNFLPTFSQNLIETLTNQLLSCEQLLELEPDSKWTLLTSLFLMLSINRKQYHVHIMNRLEKLCEVDPFRSGYYLDLRSKILIESEIMDAFDKSKNFSLKNSNLTCFCHSQYLHNYVEIDLSCNSFQSMSLNQFKVFLNCKYLNLSNNKIKSLKKLPILPKLETLLLDDNLIKEVDWEFFKMFPHLHTLSLKNNPITSEKDTMFELMKKLENIKLIICES